MSCATERPRILLRRTKYQYGARNGQNGKDMTYFICPVMLATMASSNEA